MADSLNIGSAEKPGAAEAQAAHDAAMAAKADQGVDSITSKNSQTGEDLTVTPGQEQSTGDSKPERPADIPEKFWDAEKGEVNVTALLKAQQDAEAALRQKDAPKDGPSTKESGDSDKPGDGPEGQAGAVEAAQAEFAEKGELSDDTYAALEKSGLPREMVDNYIAGRQAAVEKLESAAFAAFDGTRDGFTKASEWAAANLEPSDIEALNVQLTSTNPAIVKAGAEALAAKYAEGADIDPTVNLSGGSNNTQTGSHFKSSHELTQAMADPRYAKDAAYRDEVQQKIARASKAGVDLFS